MSENDGKQFKLLQWYDLGERFGHVEITGYKHLDGTFHEYPDPIIATNSGVFEEIYERRYRIYCHNCGNTKTVEHSNMQRTNSCGCLRQRKVIEWTAKSRKI